MVLLRIIFTRLVGSIQVKIFSAIKRPRSLLGLTLLAFSAIMLPLIIFAIRALNTVEQLSTQSEALVVTGTQIASESESVGEQLVALERNARQYYVLGDAELLDLYEQKHEQFSNSLKLVSAMELEQEINDIIASLQQDSEAMLVSIQNDPPTSRTLQDSLTQFDGMVASAADLRVRSQRLVTERLDEMLLEAREAEQALTWQLIAIVAGSIGLSVLLAIIIVKPVRQTVSAIRKLGDGSFDKEITISGPPELAALGDQLEWLRNQLLQLDEDKAKFLAHLSHELKTPLSNLREGSELLADGSAGELDKTQREIVQILRDNSVELQGLIENFLAFNTAESREAELQLASVDIRSVIDEVLFQHQLEAKRKKVTIDVVCLIEELWLDREKIRILLDNLLSNAVKFSPRGGRIEISARNHNDYLVLDVTDEGPGVHDKDRQRIFNPFYQGVAPAETTVRGTGLGLSVAREYAELHGGTIELTETKKGKGACFRVLLPMAQAANVA